MKFGSGIFESFKNLVGMIQGSWRDVVELEHATAKFKTPVAGEVVGKCNCGANIKTTKIKLFHFNQCEDCGFIK